MGARLVKLGYIFAADVPLTQNEFRLLQWMALTALDEDPTPRYFDSREASALALGRRVVDAGFGDEADARAREAAFEAVKVATRGLVALRAVERVTAGRPGRRAEYAITLDSTYARTTPEFARRKAREGRAFQPRKAQPSVVGRSSLPPGEGSAFTQGTTQEPQGQTAGITSPDRGISLAPVENFA